jgi:hypothetical protein
MKVMFMAPESMTSYRTTLAEHRLLVFYKDIVGRCKEATTAAVQRRTCLKEDIRRTSGKAYLDDTLS